MWAKHMKTSWNKKSIDFSSDSFHVFFFTFYAHKNSMDFLFHGVFICFYPHGANCMEFTCGEKFIKTRNL